MPSVPSTREPDVPSSSFSYFFREALRRIWVSRRNSFVAMAMIAISLLIVGIFLLVAENLGRAALRWQGASKITIYLEPEVSAEQVVAIDRQLAGEVRLAGRQMISREEALARFRRAFPNLTDVVGQLDANPFPPSFEVDVDPAHAQSAPFRERMDAIAALPGVDQIQYDWEWVARLRRLIDLVNLIGIAAGGVLAIAAAFTIANVIRLTMMLYREEIEIMRLVGATERMIRGPFLIEGIVQGTIGGLLSIALLFATWELARRSLAQSSSILWSFLFLGFLPWQKLAALVAGGMLAGWFGSWLSVRER